MTDNPVNITAVMTYLRTHNAACRRSLYADDAASSHARFYLEMGREVLSIDELSVEHLQALWDMGIPAVRQHVWALLRLEALMEHDNDEVDAGVGAAFDSAWRDVLTEAVPAGAETICCPKCGYHDTKMSYCDGVDLRPRSSVLGQLVDNHCARNESEHFHRRCYRCDYQWRTNDVLLGQLPA